MVVEALGYRFSGRMLSLRSRSDAERSVPDGPQAGRITEDYETARSQDRRLT